MTWTFALMDCSSESAVDDYEPKRSTYITGAPHSTHTRAARGGHAFEALSSGRPARRLARQLLESRHKVGHHGRRVRPVEGSDPLLDDAVGLRYPLVLSHVLDQGFDQERLDQACRVRRVLEHLPPKCPVPEAGLAERPDGVHELPRPARINTV